MLHLTTVKFHINRTSEGLPGEEGSRTRLYREGGRFTPPREWAAAAAAAAREEAAAREAARASFHATDGIAS